MAKQLQEDEKRWTRDTSVLTNSAMFNILKQTQLTCSQFVCAFGHSPQKPMCIDLTFYIAVYNKKLKSKICLHNPDISTGEK